MTRQQYSYLLPALVLDICTVACGNRSTSVNAQPADPTLFGIPKEFNKVPIQDISRILTGQK